MVLSALLVISARGQQKPNFSGTWKEVGSRECIYVERIEHQGPILKVTTDIRDAPKGTSSLQPRGWLLAEHMYVTGGTEQTSKNEKGL